MIITKADNSYNSYVCLCVCGSPSNGFSLGNGNTHKKIKKIDVVDYINRPIV